MRIFDLYVPPRNGIWFFFQPRIEGSWWDGVLGGAWVYIQTLLALFAIGLVGALIVLIFYVLTIPFRR